MVVRQPSFAGGEISPELYGRTDNPRYSLSLRKSENFIISPTGAALNRPGTKFIQQTRNNGQARLIPYVLSETESFVLEFTAGAIRFYKNGEPVMSGLSPYTLDISSIPFLDVDYQAGHLSTLKYAQVGKYLYITHWAYEPAKLERVTDTSWTISGAGPLNPLRPLPHTGSTGIAPSIDLSTYTAPDATHPAREWYWLLTAVFQDATTGLQFESGIHIVNTTVNLTAGGPAYATTGILTNRWAVYADRPVIIGWPTTSGTPWATYNSNYRVLAYRIYRGRGSVFGLVGEVGRTVDRFTDAGVEPNWAIQPPMNRWPFLVYDGASVFVREEEPAAIGFFEDRLVYGGTDERPTWLWFSRVNDFTNFDTPVPGYPSAVGAVEFDLASTRLEEIRSLVGLERLWVFTSGGAWTMAGAGAPLSFESVQALKQTDEGASWVSPLIVADSILYVRDKGNAVNEIGYEEARGKASTVDLTVAVGHLFDDGTITDWAYATDPNRTLWAVRSDGVLLSCTYDRRNEIAAWCKHTTDGTVEAVCVVPEGEEDVAYLVVNRTINSVATRYVERIYSRRLASRTVFTGGASDSAFLDCAKTGTALASKTVTGLSHLEAKSVYAVVDGNVHGPFTVSGGSITLDLPDTPTASVWQVGLAYASDLDPVDVADAKKELRGRPTIVSEVGFEVVASRGFMVGEDFDNLVEWRQRDVAASHDALALHTGTVWVSIQSAWNTGGRAVIRQTHPLPLSIHGLSRKVTFGDE